MRSLSACLSIVISCASVLAADQATPTQWPQFRGPRGDGHAAAKNVPLVWGEAENVAWKTPLPGRGWSSPVVLGDQIWVTTALETPASDDEVKARVRQMGMFVPSPFRFGLPRSLVGAGNA